MKHLSHKQIINLVIVAVTTTVVFCTLFIRPKLIVDSYEKCMSKKDSMVMETFPQQCITADGQKFVQPVDPGLMPEPLPEEMNNSEPGSARSYEDCVMQRGEAEMLPEVCTYPDGETFYKDVVNDEESMEPGGPLDEMSLEDTYYCVEGGWVDCMPKVGTGDETNTMYTESFCTPEYKTWATENCPDFEGFAY